VPRLPEAVACALWGAEGLAGLRRAAVVAFQVREQALAWHPTAAEFAAQHWPLHAEETQGHLQAALPGWTAWLEQRPPTEALAGQAENLGVVLDALEAAPPQEARAFLAALDNALPFPDHTLALRNFEATF